MKRTMELHRDQRGLVGKMMIVWLLLVAVLAVAAVDAGSIAMAKFQLSSAATDAAINGALEYRKASDSIAACAAAQATVRSSQPEVRIGKAFCKVDTSTGRVTITLRTTAGTMLAGRLDFTKHYAMVSQSETNGPSGV